MQKRIDSIKIMPIKQKAIDTLLSFNRFIYKVKTLQTNGTSIPLVFIPQS